ncbi:hypothetical protein Aduo_002974 [Ancylostoma duodenale]
MRVWISFTLLTTLFVMICSVTQASPFWGGYRSGSVNNRPPPSGHPYPNAQPNQAPPQRPRPPQRQPPIGRPNRTPSPYPAPGSSRRPPRPEDPPGGLAPIPEYAARFGGSYWG